MKCGLAKVNITPTLGVPIPGQLYERRATGIKDELFAKAMVIDDGKDMAAFITIDALTVERDIVLAIREMISSKTEIPQGAIMVSATHTHTGPPVITVYGNERDENYVKYLIRKICDAALLALKRMQSVNIGIGIGHEESIAFNRRFLMDDGTYRTNPGINNPSIVKPVGPIDPEVLVARVDNEDGTPIGAIVNYTCHLDVVGGDKFSADYPGELRRVLKRLYGDDFITLFFTGTCGNINHLDVTGNMKIVKDHHKKMGRILAGEVFKVMQRVEYLNNPKVLCASRHIQASIREATKEELIEARNVLNTRDKPESEILFAKDILELSRSDKRKVELEVQVIGVGDLAIVGLPGEVFVEFGLDIKRRSKFGYTAISELTNGAYGYIPVREAFEQGGYEPRLSQYTNLGPNTGYELVDSAVEILDSL